ncbi:Uncharacterized membrane protein [Haloplanus vescus]|uniref:Uncharacterized membrane protein n=1 Tax=Haloplanus vescus TaxID=555874 RepID=A0A1H4AHC4_9EURY|nr:DUF502 domain-containing protein [Haloplanus vescus]SEA35151.1 Uncharacterized membrane protein [Haloplanus vescus]
MSLSGRLRASFVTGLLLVTPLAVTLLVLQFVFVRTTRLLNPVVRATRLTSYTGNVEIVAQLLAAVLLALGITALGYLASWRLGKRLFGGVERAIRLVPLVRTVYFGVRQVSESLAQRTAGYDAVALVEFPREGVYAIGFVTNEAPRSTRRATNEDLYTVFLPNSPNPTAGTLTLVPDDDIYEVDMSVRRGLRLLVTTGLSVDDVDDLPEVVA